MLAHLGKDGWPVGSWPVGSRGRDNNWSRSIGPDWGRSIGWGRGVDGLSRVLDISNVTSVGISSVGNSLEATIGKVNVVFSLGGIAVAGLRGSKVGTAVSVIDSIGVVVCWGNIRVDWGRAVGRDWDRGRAISRSWGNDGSWGRGSVLRGSSSGSQDGEQSNKALEKNIVTS